MNRGIGSRTQGPAGPSRAGVVAVVAVALGLLGSCSKKASAPTGGKVRLSVTVDWEGAELSDAAFASLDKFRAELPGVPLSHFITPAYFTKPNADRKAIAARIKAGIAKGDDIGLHLHMWASLVKAAGVEPKLNQSFVVAGKPPFQFEDDIGFDAPPTPYSLAELRAIIANSLAIMAEAGLDASSSFRAGGWLGAPHVLEAARSEGIEVDSSATDPSWLDEEEAATVRSWVAAAWPDTDRWTQPYWIDTPAGRILEIPNSGNFADYATADEIKAYVEQALARTASDPDAELFVQFGFHYETGEEFVGHITEGLKPFANNPRVVFESLMASGARARELAGTAGKPAGTPKTKSAAPR